MKSRIKFILIAITDRKTCSDVSLEEKISLICKEGVKAVQLREKDLPGRELLALSKELRVITLSFRSSLIINERLDIAMLCKADGVHIPENGIPLSFAKSFKANLFFGRSTHSLESAVRAEKDGFDYIIFGPVFNTESKAKYGKPLGLKLLKDVCGKVTIPVFAVGGITPANAKQCKESGAHGVAVISALMKSDDLKKTVLEFKQSLGKL